jgi:uncharacterized surface protein with fasciclin (FAS1) repeats
MRFHNCSKLGAALTVALAFGASAPAIVSRAAETGGTVMVGGAAMYPSRNIVENAVHSRDHTTLVAAVQAAGLVGTLSGRGPFTVFAPTDQAFAALPSGTVPMLLEPEHKSSLVKVLTYHVVPGRLTARDLDRAIREGGNKASLTTIEGETLTLGRDGKWITVTDAKGGVAHLTISDVMQSNGVIHVIDAVLMP